jgi:hypothetical protein
MKPMLGLLKGSESIHRFGEMAFETIADILRTFPLASRSSVLQVGLQA